MVVSGASRESIEGRLRARPLPDIRAFFAAGLHELALPGGRRALVSVPQAPDGAPAGLLVMLHGAGADAVPSDASVMAIRS